MRILLVTPWYAPAYAYGGIVRVTEDHASGLAQRGHDVTVITTDAHNRDSRNPTREDTINGVRVIRFPNISNFLANRSNIYSPIGFDRWTRENISEFDRVIVHDIYTWLTFRALHHANKSGIPYAIMPHGTMSHARVTLRHSHIKQWLLEKIRPYLRDAFAVYAISDGEHDDILSVESRARTVTLGNGIDMDAIPIIDRPAARTNLGISTSTFVCMFLGRLHPLKHPDIAIRAFTRFHETHPDSILLIVGPDDGARESAQSLARTLWLEDSVRFLGTLTGRDKFETLAAADVFISPSLDEWGRPLVVAESLASGLPCILSVGCRVPKDVLGDAGIVVDSFDPLDYARAITIIAGNPDSYRRHARDVARTHFSLAQTLDILESSLTHHDR